MSSALIADKLRASILQAAIQGKLTKQRSEDGDARDLLKEIEKEKNRLIEEKIIKKEKPLPPIKEDEIPFEIPENWVWVRLGDLANYRKGPFGSALTKSMFIPKGNDAIKVYEQKNAIQKSDSLGEYYIKKDYYINKMKGFTLNGGDIIVSCAGTIGESYILPNEIELGIINQALMRVRCYSHILKEFYLYIFDYAIRSPLAVENVKGSAIKNIPPFEILKSILVPLPPFSEQHRIVEAIETALAKIDKLKTDETKLYEIQKAFPDKLRASLLQAAIQGQLTEQLPEDGNARDLLKEIEAEKARLIEEKIIKKEKPLPPISEDEIPFEIPENWVWVRLGDLANKIHYGYTASAKDIGKVGLLRITDIQNNQVDWTMVPFCSLTERERETYLLRKNDIVIARTGGTIGKSFKISELPMESVFASYLIRVVPTLGDLASYIDYYLDTPIYWEQLSNNTMGTGQPNVNATALKGLFIPLPPLTEQDRIVKKLDEILDKVDGLKKIAE